MSEFKAAGFSDEFGGGPDIVGLTTFTSPYYFVPPSGSTAERPSSPPPGMLRFNTDIGRLEVWRNDHWATILGESPNLGNQNVTNSAGGTGTRGVFAGAYASGAHMEYISVSNLGSGQSFGDLNNATSKWFGNAASRTRGIFAGGLEGPAFSSRIQFITFASTGDATSFTDTLSASKLAVAGMSNETRGVFAGGQSSPDAHIAAIDYITIASTAETTADFGDLTTDRRNGSGLSSSVRGLIAGGQTPGVTDNIEFITLSTLGNSQDFGNLVEANSIINGCFSNSTRGLLGGGSAGTNVIQFVTIATTGNAQDFGDLTVTRQEMGGVSSPTRGVFAGGRTTPSSTELNTMDYVTIPTTGDAIDFGDLSTARRAIGSVSNGHGGL